MRLLDDLRRRWWLVLLLLVVLSLLFGARVATFYTDVLWFDSIGFAPVFWTLLTTQLGLGLVAGLTMTALVGVNLLIAKRLAPRYRVPSLGEAVVERYRQALEPYATALLLVVAVVVGVLAGLSMAPEWPTYVLWANAVEFGRTDPHFGRDIGYFTFVLPFHSLLNSWLFTALAFTTVLTAVAHYVFGGIRPQSPGQKLTPQVNVHLSILLAALVAVRAWGFVLDQYLLSYSERGQVTGLSYTDVNAQLVAYQLLSYIAAVCVILFLANIWFRGWVLPLAGVGILVVAGIAMAGIFPAVIQRLQVAPQELPREREFIQRNLDMTRYAFGLDAVEFEPFAAESELTPAELEENTKTMASIRLWDPATLQNTYQQLQALRPYYSFADVDVDRYTIDGEQEQVMISVRELDERDLPEVAQTWQNRRVVFTHGFGAVASAVSTKRADGQPVFYVSDIPPQGVEELKVSNPRIYFGERPPEYSIVKTQDTELDYQEEGREEPVRYTYTGEDGVPIGSPLGRLAFALRLSEPNILLSSLITPESEILFRRQIRDRVETVAPYLKFDHDAYPVAQGDSIKWVIDGYTTSDMVPYSERVDLGSLTLAEQRVLIPVADAEGNITIREDLRPVPGIQGRANYIRNSVKAVVDGYDGTVTLYVADPEDPILQAWRNVFPDSFTPIEDAGEELQAHFRYPEDMFRVQAALFQTYHIQGADEFYSKADAWRIPQDAPFFANQAPLPTEQRKLRPMRPYYLLMRLPGEDQEEFALIQPFTPAQRDNLTAWLAARSDPEHYGQLRAYIMPPTRTVFGPEQVQARINQDDAVSEQITLWNQSGSRVIYGNLLVIPVADSLLYAQPLFLRAEQSDIPELRKTVLVFGESVVMRDTLEESLVAVFGQAAGAVDLPTEDGEAPPDESAAPDEPSGTPGEPGAALDPRVADLIARAFEAAQAAQAALEAGNLGEYQERTAEAAELLEQANALLGGGPTDTATPPPPEPTP